MSFLLIRELSVIFFFLFYTYFYFAIDEEFIVFIIICLWLLFIIVVYLKTISSIFFDSMEALSSEFFFFHDKKNMILAIFRDQYFDYINLNKFMYNFFLIFQNSINNSLNSKVLSFYANSNLFLSESVNFFKQYYKVSLMFVYLSIFSFFYNVVSFMFFELNNLVKIFESKYNLVRYKLEAEHVKKIINNKKSYSITSINVLLPFLVQGNKNLSQFSVFLLYRHLLRNSKFLTVDDVYLLDILQTLKNSSVLRITQKLNVKRYFETLFLYALLREFSFIDLY